MSYVGVKNLYLGQMPADNEEMISEVIEERLYQNELALPAQRGQNCIIIAPTGSEKTIVAVKIIKVLDNISYSFI